MQTNELMTGQAFTFYARVGTGVTLRKGNIGVMVNNMQMDGYGWKEQVILIGNGNWTAPRSGWFSVQAKQRSAFYITEPLSIVLQCRLTAAKWLGKLLTRPSNA
ncbi:hypothetical protein [Glaciimonas sp. PAMC28666]|uniref:hypothetical protein n=1 Tax=Glaciimonas sp. PAMC28666 TaxID=2807626 RepID=UPI0019657EAC|nr:hypothetical protein [Glaciimonas sp. PAMC28666]QRX82680.1 hypothetical protein JQN73_21935 [Glaciimonas sp. PAMC28666]